MTILSKIEMQGEISMRKCDRQGFVHLYVGDGKGKTTAAVGLAVRALGCGHRVMIAQFLKGVPTGELEPLERLGATLMRDKDCLKFTFQMTPEELERTKRCHAGMLQKAHEAAAAGDVELLILDEVVDAVNAGVIPLESLTSLLGGRAAHVEVVLSGRNPPEILCDIADYYTIFKCVKHPYQTGVPARKGIEH